MYFNKRYFDQSNRKYRTWFWEIPTIIEALATHNREPKYFFDDCWSGCGFNDDNDERMPYLIIRLIKM